MHFWFLLTYLQIDLISKFYRINVSYNSTHKSSKLLLRCVHSSTTIFLILEKSTLIRVGKTRYKLKEDTFKCIFYIILNYDLVIYNWCIVALPTTIYFITLYNFKGFFTTTKDVLFPYDCSVHVIVKKKIQCLLKFQDQTYFLYVSSPFVYCVYYNWVAKTAFIWLQKCEKRIFCKYYVLHV